jgi:ribosome-binding ATPase YchF (GTP1/OBG family)
VLCKNVFPWRQEHTRAPQAAGTIHTDFEKGFVQAEVMPYAALHEHGSEVRCAAMCLWCAWLRAVLCAVPRSVDSILGLRSICDRLWPAHTYLARCAAQGAVRGAGKLIMAGKGYVVQDGDIMYVKANTVGLTKKK